MELHPVRVPAVAEAAVDGGDWDGGKALHTQAQEERLHTALQGIQQREPSGALD